MRAEKGTIRFDVTLRFPPGFKINPQAPPAYWIEPADEGVPQASREGSRCAERDDHGHGPPVVPCGGQRRPAHRRLVRLDKSLATFPIELPVDAAAGRDLLRIGLSYYYCREGAEGLCKVGGVVWTVPLELKSDAPTASIPLVHRVER